MYVAANSGKKSEVCVSESDIAGDEMNALACVANSGCISASGAGVSHTNSKGCNNNTCEATKKAAQRQTGLRANRLCAGLLLCV
jgi:hypothetical protein